MLELYNTKKQELIDFLETTGFSLLSFEDDDEGYDKPISIRFKDPNQYPEKNWCYFNKKLNQELNSLNKTTMNVSLKDGQVCIDFSISLNAITASFIAKDIDSLIICLKKQYYKVAPIREYFSVLIKPTHRCPLDCKYCYDKIYREVIHDDMSFECLEKILELLSRYTEEVQWIWHGGEFTMMGIPYYKKFYDEIVPKFPMLQIDSHGMSNGVNLTPEWIDFLDKYNIDTGVSYNAFYQAEIRCSSQSKSTIQEDEKKAAHIEDMLQYSLTKKNPIGVIDVITNKNSKDLIPLYEYYKSTGITPCFNIIFHTGQSEKNALEAEVKEYTKNFFDFFKYWFYDKNGIYERTCLSFLSMVTGVQDVPCTYSDCRENWVAVNPRGDIYPCDRYYPEVYRMGNINDLESLDNMFQTEAYQKYSNEVQKRFDTHCNDCGYFFACCGGCNGSALESSGDCSGIETFYCEFFKGFFNKIYDFLRDIDWLSAEINPKARKIFEENQFASVKDIKDYIAKQNVVFPLEYNPDDLVHCSEFIVFNYINQTNKRTNGFVRHNNTSCAKCCKNSCKNEQSNKKLSDDEIRQQREKDISTFLFNIAASTYANKRSA